MTSWNNDAPPPLPEQDAGGGTAFPANVPAQGVMVQTQFGGALQIRRAALALPRRMDVVKRSIDQLAELVDDVGDQGDTWQYAFPVKNRRKGTTDWITGPTIKCTNAIARSWGNCSVMVSRVDDIGSAWVLYGTFVDYETGFEMTRAFQQRKGQSTMGSDAARGEDITFQIGVSKSMRNVVNNALGDIVAYALEVKDRRWRRKVEQNQEAYRTRIRSRLETIGYPLVKVEAYVGRGKLDSWPVEAIAQVSKILAAHAEGVLEDLDSVFAPKGMDIDGTAVDPETGEVQAAAAPAPQADPQAAPPPAPAQAHAAPAAAAEPDNKPVRRRALDDENVIVLGKPYRNLGTAFGAASKAIDDEDINVLIEHEDQLRETLAVLQKTRFDPEGALVKRLDQRFADETTTEDEDREPPPAAQPEPQSAAADPYETWLNEVYNGFSTTPLEALIGRKSYYTAQAQTMFPDRAEEAAAAVEAAVTARRAALTKSRPAPDDNDAAQQLGG